MAINVYLPPELREILHGRDNATIKLKIGDFLNDDFFKKYTKFKDLKEFVDYSPYTDEELSNDTSLLEDKVMSRYIELTTPFKNYKSMIGFAVRENLKKYYKVKETSVNE